MKLACTFAASAVLSAFLTPGAGEEIAFRPAEGSELARRFRWEGSGSVDEIEMKVGDQVVDPAMLELPEDLDFDFELSYAVLDRFEKMDEARPLVLVRHFLEGSMRGSGLGGEGSDDFGTLHGKSVRFTWNEEDERYDLAWAGEEGEDEDLEALAEDLDLRALLPGKEVGAGDAWTVEGFSLWGALVPGLDLDLFFDTVIDLDEEVPAAVKVELKRLFEESEATCSFVGLQTEDSGNLAEIEITSRIEQSASFDPSVFGEELQADEVEMQDVEISLELVLEGSLLWDLDAGRFASFAYEVEVGLEGQVAGRIPAVNLEMEMRGAASAKIAFEATAELP